MLFGKKKKISNEIALRVLNSLRASFAMTDHIDECGKFRPPFGFWMDDYIIGFCHMQIGLFITCFFDGKSMSTQKKGEIIMLSLSKICGDDWRQVMNRINDCTMGEAKGAEEYGRGAHDADTLFCAIYGLLTPDDNDPVLSEARSLAEAMHKDQIMGNDTSSYAALGGAIALLTISKHIREKYLEKAA